MREMTRFIELFFSLSAPRENPKSLLGMDGRMEEAQIFRRFGFG